MWIVRCRAYEYRGLNRVQAEICFFDMSIEGEEDVELIFERPDWMRTS